MRLLAGFVLTVTAAAQTHVAAPVPAAYRALTRPLGGVPLPGAKPTRSKTASRYVGPVYYTPNAFDTSAYQPYQPDSVPPANVAQPLVVNQYFLTQGSTVPGVTDAPQPFIDAPASNPGDPLVEPATYYLIAYKDRSMYSALAYWVEGDTLHYVTTQNTHNQASLSLIDLDQTYKLNADRSVPFSVPGK